MSLPKLLARWCPALANCPALQQSALSHLDCRWHLRRLRPGTRRRDGCWRKQTAGLRSWSSTRSNCRRSSLQHKRPGGRRHRRPVHATAAGTGSFAGCTHVALCVWTVLQAAGRGAAKHIVGADGAAARRTGRTRAAAGHVQRRPGSMGCQGGGTGRCAPLAARGINSWNVCVLLRVGPSACSHTQPARLCQCSMQC